MKSLIRIAFVILLGSRMISARGAEEPGGIAYAGWAVSTPDPDVHEERPALGGAGLEVVELDPKGPAAQANVQTNDILLQLDEQRLFTAGQLRALLRTLSPGGVHRLRVLRDGGLEELDLRLGEQPSNPVTTPELRVTRVPFELWNSTADWPAQLANVVQQEPPAADADTAAVPPRSLAMWLGDGAEAWNNNIEVVILLQRENTASMIPQAPTELPFLQPPADPSEGVGNFAMTDEQGSVEVVQRGGRDYVTVRDARGSIVYEGPMDTEDDVLRLRPLRPGLRQAVEASVGPERTTAPAADVEVLRVPMPPRIF